MKMNKNKSLQDIANGMYKGPSKSLQERYVEKVRYQYAFVTHMVIDLAVERKLLFSTKEGQKLASKILSEEEQKLLEVNIQEITEAYHRDRSDYSSFLPLIVELMSTEALPSCLEEINRNRLHILADDEGETFYYTCLEKILTREWDLEIEPVGLLNYGAILMISLADSLNDTDWDESMVLLLDMIERRLLEWLTVAGLSVPTLKKQLENINKRTASVEGGNKRKETTDQQEHAPICKLIDEMISDGTYNKYVGEHPGKFARAISDRIIEYNLENKDKIKAKEIKKLHKYSQDRLKDILFRHYSTEKGVKLTQNLIRR